MYLWAILIRSIKQSKVTALGAPRAVILVLDFGKMEFVLQYVLVLGYWATGIHELPTTIELLSYRSEWGASIGANSNNFSRYVRLIGMVLLKHFLAKLYPI